MKHKKTNFTPFSLFSRAENNTVKRTSRVIEYEHQFLDRKKVLCTLNFLLHLLKKSQFKFPAIYVTTKKWEVNRVAAFLSKVI